MNAMIHKYKKSVNGITVIAKTRLKQHHYHQKETPHPLRAKS